MSDDAIAHLGRLSKLEIIEMAGTGISDTGLAQFASAHPNVVEAHFDRTDISDEGLKHLHQLKKLRVLNLKETQVTLNGILEFKQAVPDCEVED